jgi:acetoin utilization protein AcuB
MRVREWMIASPPAPRTTVATALRLLREHRLPALPVWAGDRLRGLVTEKALLRLTPSEVTTLDVYELRNVLETLSVERAMASSEAVTPDMPLEDAAITMLRERVDVIPVVDSGRLVGLLPWTSLLEAWSVMCPSRFPAEAGSTRRRSRSIPASVRKEPHVLEF